jgi:ubiquinol-cytochrome c reductase cytochrome b subunit
LGLFPFNLGDALGFEEVNELVSPVHIVPEWYFLWAYAILRAVPSKLLGVLTLLMGLLVFFLMTPGYTPSNDLFQKVLVLFFITNGVVLSILGSLEPLPPFVRGSILFSVVYFVLVLLIILV